MSSKKEINIETQMTKEVFSEAEKAIEFCEKKCFRKINGVMCAVMPINMFNLFKAMFKYIKAKEGI